MPSSTPLFPDDDPVPSTPAPEAVPVRGEARPTLYVLDAFSLIFQVFHAIRNSPNAAERVMTGPAGQPTNAVFGIIRDILNLLRDRKPDYLAAAFDGAGRLLRSDVFPEYKAQRAEMPEDLVPQIPVIRRAFEAFRVPVLMFEGYEADDVIATLTRRGEERGLDVFICTADKDARQLLNDHVRVFNVRKQEVLDTAALKADWGVRPDQVVDLLSLTGDAVDNVPGVPGIGIKTGAKLIEEFETLDGLLANVAKVSGAKRKENLVAFADVARRARELIQLHTELPLTLDWDALKVTPPDVKALKALCIECGFHRFVNELGPDPQQPAADWDYSGYQTVDTPETFTAFVTQLAAQPRFCFDTETTSVDPLRADLVGLSFCWESGRAYYLPVRGPSGSRLLDESMVLDALRPILANAETEKIGQNAKYDMLVLQRAGVTIGGPVTDTMVLSYLLESGERNHNLDQLSQRLLDHPMIPISDLIGKGKNQLSMAEVDVSKAAKYAAEDADATWQIEAILNARMRAEGLWSLYADLESPLIHVLADMETIGIKVDVALLGRLSTEFAGRLEAIETEIYHLAGRTFNIGSGPQLRQILFEELKLPVLQKTPGGEPSTAAEVLEELAARHPLPKLLIQHRQLSKLKGTYLDALPVLVHADGRIHTSFNQVVAATGRLSSSDPNLQNIPTRTEDGRQIRQAFVPGAAGWKLVTADYSQIELRILAHFSQDPALLAAFRNDQDIHAAVAAKIFQVPESEVDDDKRRVAKTVNFGVVYGIKPYGLATRLGISQKEAAAFIESYFAEYSGVDSFITMTLESAQTDGRVETILGRRRPINGIKTTTGHDRNLAERTAINTVIQGSAADLIKRAMLAVDRDLRREGLAARLLLQIHDELVFECPAEEVETVARVARQAMTQALALEVPLKVDVAAGANWLDVEDLE
jgi:DNA polymerase I